MPSGNVTVGAAFKLAAPAFDQPSDTAFKTMPSFVNVTNTATGVAFWYTTGDQAYPDGEWTQVPSSDQIQIDKNVTIRAVAVKGNIVSDVTEVSYTVPTVATPVITQDATKPTKVTITCTTEDATIYYTTNGETPVAGTWYTSTCKSGTVITLTKKSTTIKAFARMTKYADSEVVTSTLAVDGLTYPVTAKDGSHGSISVYVSGKDTTPNSTLYVAEDDTVTVTVQPDNGYMLNGLGVRGWYESGEYKIEDSSLSITLKETGENTYTFTMPYEEVSVQATFRKVDTLVQQPMDGCKVTETGTGTYTVSKDGTDLGSYTVTSKPVMRESGSGSYLIWQQVSVEATGQQTDTSAFTVGGVFYRNSSTDQWTQAEEANGAYTFDSQGEIQILVLYDDAKAETYPLTVVGNDSTLAGSVSAVFSTVRSNSARQTITSAKYGETVRVKITATPAERYKDTSSTVTLTWTDINGNVQTETIQNGANFQMPDGIQSGTGVTATLTYPGPYYKVTLDHKYYNAQGKGGQTQDGCELHLGSAANNLSGLEIVAGGTASVNIVTKDGKVCTGVTLTWTEGGQTRSETYTPTSSGSYSFTMPEHDVTVTATFGPPTDFSFWISIMPVGTNATNPVYSAKLYKVESDAANPVYVCSADSVACMNSKTDKLTKLVENTVQAGDHYILEITAEGKAVPLDGDSGSDIQKCTVTWLKTEGQTATYDVVIDDVINNSASSPGILFNGSLGKTTTVQYGESGGTVRVNGKEFQSGDFLQVGTSCTVTVEPDSAHYVKSVYAVTDDTATPKEIGINYYESGSTLEYWPTADSRLVVEFESLETLADQNDGLVYENGYLWVTNENGLQYIREIVNGGCRFSGTTIKLKGDIRLMNDWTPIGTYDDPFLGTFDGNGKTISGLDVTTSTYVHSTSSEYQTAAGLFGYATYGTIQNLTVSGDIILHEMVTFIGGIAGRAKTVQNCVSKVTIYSDRIARANDYKYIGGVVGFVDTVTGCLNMGSITVDASYYEQGADDIPIGNVGGIAGMLLTSADSCGNYGSISLTSFKTGLGSSFITNDAARGSHTYVRWNCVGGIAGQVCGAYSPYVEGYEYHVVTISNCFNTGDLTGDFEKAGGIVGFGQGGILTVTNCYNTGVIAQTATGQLDGGATATVRLGGIVGATNVNISGGTSETNQNNQGLLTITNCYSTNVPTCKTSYSYMGIGRIEANSVTDRMNLNGSTKVINCNSMSDVSQYVPNITDDGKYALTLNITADETVHYTAVLTSGGKTLKAVSQSTGTKAVFESLDPGEYSYTISAQGYATETGTVTIGMLDRAIPIALRAGTGLQVYVAPRGASFALSYLGATVAYDAKNVLYRDGVYYDVYTYSSLYADDAYSYSASYTGYVGSQRQFLMDSVGSAMTVALVSRSNSTGTSISGNETITKGGTYLLQRGATGKLTIDTTDAVTLVGDGVNEGAQYKDLYINCKNAGSQLTLEDVYISNTSGVANTINFTGQDNKLTFAGANILDQDTGASGYAMIHVGSRDNTTLTISCDSDGNGVADGVAYLYKSEQGAGIGGNSTTDEYPTGGEINGTINIENANLFIKGTKQGALIGSGAVTGKESAGEINITNSTLNLIANARGAAIGGGAGNTGAGYGGSVTITDSSVNINVNYDGAAIGGGGYGGGNDARGGVIKVVRSSVRAYIDENAAGCWGQSEAGVNGNAAITATVTVEKGRAKLAVIKFATLPSGNVTVKDKDGNTLYSGSLHQYTYINESRDKGSQLGVTSTMGNWSESTCQYLYLYVPSTYDGGYTVEIDGKTYTALEYADDDEGTVYVVSPEGVKQLDAPAQLEAQSVAATSVTLTAPAKSTQDSSAVIQYRVSSNEGLTWTSWQTSAQFTNLKPETTYYFQARYQAKTTGYADSNASFTCVVTTPEDRDRFTASAVTVSGSTAAATISGTSLSYYADESGVLTADLTTGKSSVTSVQVTIAADTLRAMAPQVKAKAATASYSLKIKTDLGQITLSNAALAGLANTGKDAVLSVSTSTDQGNTVYSYRVNGSTYTASGTVTLELPYSRQSSTKSVVVYNGKNEVESTYSVSGATITLTTSYLGDFTVKEETRGDPYASVWDGLSLDLTWFTPGQSTYYIGSPAQLAGLAALVNGIYNEEITTIVGDADYIVDNVSKGSSSEDGGSNQSTDTYHYGDYNFAGATIYLTADINMGGSQGANYMPIGGQYLMVKDDTSTKIDASFCGTLDGQGHTISNISCDRHSSGNYGDGQSVGLIGRLGVHDSDSASLRPTGAGVRNLAVEGSFYANRSVGGIVGKIGKTNGGVTIENCANFASVTATDAKGCGGIVGAAWNGGVIRNCYNTGTITSTYPNPTGGIAGSNEVSIENCYNVGKISASSSSYAMAIGTNNGGAPYSVITNCWYLDGSAPGGGYYSSGANNDGAMTEANMKKQSFVTTLGDAFAMDTNGINNGYPVLSWQPHTATTSPELKATTVVGRDGAATITIDSAALATTLKGLKTSTELSITADISASTTVTSVETRLSQSDLKSIANAGHTLLIDTPVAQFNLPNAALKDIASQKGSEVTISATQTEGGAVSIQIAVDGQTMTTVSGGFQVTLPVSSKTDSTILVRIDGDGNEVQVEDAVFSSDGKSVSVTVDGSCILKVKEKTTAVLSTTEIDKGVATTTIDSAALLAALKKANGEQMSIEAEIPSGIYVYSAVTVLTGEDVKNVASYGSALKVSSTLADITLSSTALNSVAQLGGEKVTITATNETSGVTSIQVSVDGTPMTTVADGLLVTLPVSEVTGKTILVLVDGDENETELTDAVFGKDSVTVRVDGSCTLKITEREETIASKTEITDGAATTTIDSEALAEQLKEVKAGTELVVKVEIPEGETVTETQTILAQEDLKAIADAEVDLKITSPLAAITLPASALADLVSGEGENITITAAQTELGTKIQLAVDDEVIETVSGGLKVSLPAETTTAGTVLVLVDAEGNETIIKKSALSGGNVAALLTGSCTVKVVDNSKTFADVGESWYTDAVDFASSHDLFKGTGNDQFDPEGEMTRSMLVTVLYRLENEPDSLTTSSFSDVADSWYTDAVIWANANKIVEGNGNGSFAPDDSITREQMATILYRYMDHLGLDVTLGDSGEMKELSSPDNVLTRYADAGNTSTWANEPMQWAVTSGLITGKGTGDDLLLDPSGTAQRAEVATMLQRLINLMLK